MSAAMPPHFTQSPTHYAKITLLLIAINVALFVWQVFSGVNIQDPSTVDAIRWGADYAPLTYLQQPFRLVSSMFFHFGFMHILLNMWALFIFGNLAEQLFGRVYYIGLYMLCGIAGSLLSGYIDISHSQQLLQLNEINPDLIPRVAAGASGAVMGLGGALTCLAFLPILPRQPLALNRKSFFSIMLINLAFGILMPGINNAAHVGGMLMGALLTLLWYGIQYYALPRIYLYLVLLLSAALCYGFYQYNLSQLAEIKPYWQEILQYIPNH
ncbi:rhomboid family intramembrane serine protease [Acinetobacter larvae]|uniref:Rhomboid family intramembrane serine protease n=1 Tax=Acinetobacter larvae TaxID=1789224 RepID=A0A1B2M1J9_9GAMM|nr:rhomboid family intramembrane serine protease [Acinetobacter larvae]AOA59076.1 rhomboid family intramembrane serine protease [Acinetobacter larvae]